MVRACLYGKQIWIQPDDIASKRLLAKCIYLFLIFQRWRYVYLAGPSLLPSLPHITPAVYRHADRPQETNGFLFTGVNNTPWPFSLFISIQSSLSTKPLPTQTQQMSHWFDSTAFLTRRRGKRVTPTEHHEHDCPGTARAIECGFFCFMWNKQINK